MTPVRSMPRVQPSSHPLGAVSSPAAMLQTAQQPALALCALGLIGLGVLSLAYGDFALAWQPVAPWIPGRTALAYLTGAIEVLVGLGLSFRATTALAVRVLLPGVVLWQLLKAPDIFAAPTVEAVYLSFGETAILLAGGLTLFARLADLAPNSPLAFLTTERTLRLARLYFGLWIIPIGISHFVYHDATIRLIPMWIPNRSFFAYLTGAGQIASGLGLLFNVLPRIAAYAEVAQLAIYTVLIWIPAVVFGPNADVLSVFGVPGPRLPLTALLVTWFPAACALAIAQNIPAKSRPSR